MPPKHQVPNLGRLVRVDLREVWAHEALSFTPWLAKEENLAELAKALELPGLELVGTEQSVEEYAADIVARIPETDHIVLIENQLERSDHSHLGQLLTYAAGTEAVAIVWVTPNFSSGHRAALDWLNRKTVEQLGFFAVEIEAWRIGDSDPAPKFNVLVQPNEWARTMRASVRTAENSPTAAGNIEYWSAFHECAVATGAPHRPASDPVRGPNYYVYFLPGEPWCYLSAYVSRSSQHVGVYLCLSASSANFDVHSVYNGLLADKGSIEAETGIDLSWREARPGSLFHIVAKLANVDPDDSAHWGRQHAWIAECLTKMRKAFEPRLLKLREAAGPRPELA